MKNLFFLFILFIIISCSPNRGVYWCGDHPCINKKEKEAYFKKTMIVEVKSSKNKNYKNISEIEKIMQEAQSKEKKRIKDEKDLTKQIKLEQKKQIKEEKNLAKQLKLEEKKQIKEEKNLAKQLKLEEKKQIKEEKNLAKQVKLEEKRRIKDEKKSSKRKIIVSQKKQLKKKVDLDAGITNTEIKLGKFSELVEKITKKNTFRPYPDINDIPN